MIPETIPKVARVTVNLPWKVWNTVQELAARNGITKTEVLRRAIGTEEWRQRILAEEGADIVVRRRMSDGSDEYVRVEWGY